MLLLYFAMESQFTRSSRKYCPHCNEYLAPSTFYNHRSGEQGDESTSPMLNSVQDQMPILPPNSSFAESPAVTSSTQIRYIINGPTLSLSTQLQPVVASAVNSICMSPAVITFPSNVTSSSTMTSCNHGISPPAGVSKNSFVLKFRTNQIKICQACRFNYEGAKDTIGLVVALAE